MNKKIALSIYLLLSIALHAEIKMYIHQSDNISLGARLTDIENLHFSSDGAYLNFQIGGSDRQYAMANIDSISFADNSDTVYVQYHNTYASVINPLAFEGVSVSVDGADVVVQASEDIRDVNYVLSGTTSDGMFKVYSEKRYNLFLKGVHITHSDGPAINLQSKKKATITLMAGTTSTLTDGSSYPNEIAAQDSGTEDQKAALFCEGNLVFQGSGSLTVNGKGSLQHAICSDDFIQIDGGNIVVPSSVGDGIHTNAGVALTSGTLDITADGDAIDGGEGYVKISGGSVTTKNMIADANGIKCDSILVVTNGTLNVSVSGDQSKGLKSGKDMILNGGNVVINTSGNAVLQQKGTGYDPAYCSAIKSETGVAINGATITITSSGKAGKGISSNGNINVLSGNIQITTTGNGETYSDSTGTSDAYHATCITADGDINLLGGTITVSSSGSAGKGITADGALTVGVLTVPIELNITTTGSEISISQSDGGGRPGGGGPGGGGMGGGEAAEAKAISCNGDVTINNGTVTISSADDGIKSATSITINKGTVSINGSTEGMEAPSITVKDGTVSIVASDDGFNATNGNGGEQNDGSLLNLNGGNIQVNVTNGDGLDSNGSINMSSGTVVVHGPQSAPEVGLDYNGTFNISGGLLLATGPNSGNMIEATSTSSSQYAIKATMNSMLNTSTLFHIQDADGNTLVTYKPVRSVYYIVFSSPELKSGSTYYIYTGGSSTGTHSNGIYTGGTYSGGTLKKSVTISGKVTNVSF